MIAAVLLVGFAISNAFFDDKSNELYTVAVNTIVLLHLFVGGVTKARWMPVIAAGLFFFGGVVIKPDRYRRILGIRR